MGAVILSFSTVACCWAASEGDGQNAALSKPYTLEPEPNYRYCTDDGDARQLTDGKRVGTSKQQLWSNKGCIGWKTQDPVEVIIDLQQSIVSDCLRSAVFRCSAKGLGVLAQRHGSGE